MLFRSKSKREQERERKRDNEKKRERRKLREGKKEKESMKGKEREEKRRKEKKRERNNDKKYYPVNEKNNRTYLFLLSFSNFTCIDKLVVTYVCALIIEITFNQNVLLCSSYFIAILFS